MNQVNAFNIYLSDKRKHLLIILNIVLIVFIAYWAKDPSPPPISNRLILVRIEYFLINLVFQK